MKYTIDERTPSNFVVRSEGLDIGTFSSYNLALDKLFCLHLIDDLRKSEVSILELIESEHLESRESNLKLEEIHSKIKTALKESTLLSSEMDNK